MTLTSLPFFTDVDPAQDGEGCLDPLGLAGTAERLAELVSPGITKGCLAFNSSRRLLLQRR